MAYDEQLAERVQKVLKRRKGFEEKKMFGGMGFLLNGNMCVGVWKEFLILRIGLDSYDEILENEFAQVFDITGRVMQGWVMIEPAGCKKDEQLKEWVLSAIKFVKTLPKK